MSETSTKLTQAKREEIGKFLLRRIEHDTKMIAKAVESGNVSSADMYHIVEASWDRTQMGIRIIERIYN